MVLCVHFGISANIGIGLEMKCLPYAGLFISSILQFLVFLRDILGSRFQDPNILKLWLLILEDLVWFGRPSQNVRTL